MQGSKQTVSPRSGRVEWPAARSKGRRAGVGRRPGCFWRTRRWCRPGLPPLALVLCTGNNGRPRREWARSDDSAAQQAGSNGLLRAAGRGKVAAACSSSSCGCDEGEKQIDFAALKSTGWTQNARQPASRGRRASRKPAAGRSGPEGDLPLGRYGHAETAI